MKKLILAVAMLLATNITAMADDTNSNDKVVTEAYDINVNINSLARYLELSKDQIEPVKEIQTAFSEGLKNASTYNERDRRKRMVNNSIDYSLRNMSYILTDKQYKKYLRILNVTLNNRGIER